MTPPIDVTDDDAAWDPNQRCSQYDCKYNVVFQEFEKTIDIYVFDDVPESLHNIMNSPFALTLRSQIKSA
jgi:hypothetical protein